MKPTPLTDKLSRAKTLLQKVLDAYPEGVDGSTYLEEAIERISISECEIEPIEEGVS